jgi:alpha-mannosidase
MNPLGWERSGEVKLSLRLPSNPYEVVDASGKVLPSRFTHDDNTAVTEIVVHLDNVPALGFRKILLQPQSAAANLAAQKGPAVDQQPDSISFDNGKLRVTVSKSTGCITSLVEKKSNFETLASGACGNQLQFFKDTPKDYDAWNVDPGTLDAPPMTIEKADAVELVGERSAHPGIRITRHWQNSKFVQTLTLAGDEVNVDNEFDWHEAHVLLKAAFPLAATSDLATYEIPYGTIDRPTTRNNSWEKAQFEVPAMRWADVGDGKHGLSIINDTKYGYDAVGNLLRLTLLRSPKWPDPEADMGHHNFHYALYPHAGTWKEAMTVRHGYEYNYPLQAVVTTRHPGTYPAEHSFASVSPENVVLTAVKKAEDAKGLIFRVYEWEGKDANVEFHVPPGPASATMTNLQEQPEGGPLTVDGDVVKAPIHPYEILTIRVDYPNGGPKQ